MPIDLELLKAKIRANQYVFSQYADLAAADDDLSFAQIEEALLSSTVLEQYEDTGRGESCLVVGFAGETPIHAVCGWRGDRVALITVYIPRPPKFVDPWTRAGGTDA